MPAGWLGAEAVALGVRVAAGGCILRAGRDGEADRRAGPPRGAALGGEDGQRCGDRLALWAYGLRRRDLHGCGRGPGRGSSMRLGGS
jgi:hypothetical protein